MTDSGECRGATRLAQGSGEAGLNKIEHLTSYRRGLERINGNWSAFLAKRESRLEQQRRHGIAAERVAENIIEDLFRAGRT